MRNRYNDEGYRSDFGREGGTSDRDWRERGGSTSWRDDDREPWRSSGRDEWRERGGMSERGGMNERGGMSGSYGGSRYGGGWGAGSSGGGDWDQEPGERRFDTERRYGGGGYMGSTGGGSYGTGTGWSRERFEDRDAGRFGFREDDYDRFSGREDMGRRTGYGARGEMHGEMHGERGEMGRYGGREGMRYGRENQGYEPRYGGMGYRENTGMSGLGSTYGQGDRGQQRWSAMGGSMGSSMGMQRGRGPKGYRRSDERIREDIIERFIENGLDASEIEINVKDCEVTLSGNVHQRVYKHRMEDIAEQVSGVKDVHNQIKVKRQDEETERRESAVLSAGSDNGNRRNATTNVGRS